MNKPTFLCGLAILISGGLFAQTAPSAATQIRVKRMKVEVAAQMTPNIQAQYVTEKRWKPKTWIEVDTQFDVDIARALGGDDASYGALEFKYYLATNARTKDGKFIVLAGTVAYSNIPTGENHALAYVSPATLKSALQKENGGKNDIVAHAVIIQAGTEVLQFESTQPGKWWEDATKFEVRESAIVAKSKTPFSVLWGDYDVQGESK